MADLDQQQISQLLSCLDRIRNGDQGARRELIGVVSGRFRQLAHLMLGEFVRLRQWVDTDDVWNAALMRLTRTLDSVQPDSVRDLHGLLALNIRRELKDLARHYYRQGGPGGREAGFEQDLGAREALEANLPAASSSGLISLLEWSEFHDEAGQLPTDQKNVFDLLYYEGVSQEEAANELGVSKSTVRLRWYQAKKSLHDRIVKRHPDARRSEVQIYADE